MTSWEKYTLPKGERNLLADRDLVANEQWRR
jgi:hypothetical protein